MSQSSLTAFSPESEQPCNSCADCLNRRGPVQVVGGKRMVRCLTSLRDYRENCNAHDDGTGLDAMKQIAEKGYITPRRRA